MRFASAVMAVCLLLAGCGGSEEPKAAATKKPATTSTPAPTKTTKTAVAAPKGVPAPGDLRSLQCKANGKGVWSAAGVLKNGSDKAASYQVTAFVGEADGEDGKALTKEFPNVNAGGSVKIELAKIPAAKDAAQCYVQVLRK